MVGKECHLDAIEDVRVLSGATDVDCGLLYARVAKSHHSGSDLLCNDTLGESYDGPSKGHASAANKSGG